MPLELLKAFHAQTSCLKIGAYYGNIRTLAAICVNLGFPTIRSFESTFISKSGDITMLGMGICPLEAG